MSESRMLMVIALFSSTSQYPGRRITQGTQLTHNPARRMFPPVCVNHLSERGRPVLYLQLFQEDGDGPTIGSTEGIEFHVRHAGL